MTQQTPSLSAALAIATSLMLISGAAIATPPSTSGASTLKSKTSSTNPASTTIDDLRNQLQASGAKWHAGESAVSRMPTEQWSTVLGLQPSQAPDVEFDNHEPESLADTSSGVRSELAQSTQSLDWRMHNGSNWVSPILNQGQCGSCVAFASIGTMETQLRIESGYPNFNIKLSPQYLFSCGGAYCDFGWEPTKAANFLKNYGATDESCMPYTSNNDTTTSCRKACGDSVSRRVRISSFTQPTDSERNLAAIKEALKNGPLVTTMNVYQDFMYYAGGIYKHVTGKRAGSHSISIVGYNDQDRALIMRNSWGPDWGEQGFARISYDDISGLGDSTWSYQTQPFKGISLNDPQDASYAYKTLNVQTHSTVRGTKSVHVQIFNEQGAIALSQTIGSQASLNISSLGAGRYEIEATALGTHGVALATSQRHYFFVSGATADMSSPLPPATTSGVSLSHFATLAQKGPKNLKLSLTTLTTHGTSVTPDPVLAAHLHFLQVQANVGNQELTRAAFHFVRTDGAAPAVEVVRETRRLKNAADVIWKTDGLAAGKYEYWLSGELSGSGISEKAESAHQVITIQ